MRLLARETATPWTLWLCHAGGKRLPHRVRAFVELARAALGHDRFLV